MNSRVHQEVSTASKIDHVVEETKQTPFTKIIKNTQARDIKKLRLPIYEGKTDIRAHMTALNIVVRRAHFSKQEKEAGLCKLFAEHLFGSALDWFSKLEERSIGGFTQLLTAFVKQYSMFMEKVTSDTDLWILSEGPNDLL